MNDLQSRVTQNANSDFYSRILGAMPPRPPMAQTQRAPPGLPAFLRGGGGGAGAATSGRRVLQLSGTKRSAEDRQETFPAAFLLLGCPPPEFSAPPVTVVLEGRSICQRIRLQEHSGYDTFAHALRRMFDDYASGSASVSDELALTDADNVDSVTLSNAVPGHVIAYEDIEGDLLLAGDLSWKDFIRAAKRIRILPAKRKIKC